MNVEIRRVDRVVSIAFLGIVAAAALIFWEVHVPRIWMPYEALSHRGLEQDERAVLLDAISARQGREAMDALLSRLVHSRDVRLIQLAAGFAARRDTSPRNMRLGRRRCFELGIGERGERWE